MPLVTVIGASGPEAGEPGLLPLGLDDQRRLRALAGSGWRGESATMEARLTAAIAAASARGAA